jgi:tricarballylate dehydrogenase
VLTEVDVIVVGGGNAALCAAISARENGASVLVLERAPYAERGGNSAFTAGAMRFAYANEEEIRSIVTDLSEEEIARTDFGTYTEAQFFGDLARVTENRTDPELADLIVSNSLGTLQWMRGHGVRFLPIYGRQAFEVDGRFKFWGGLTIEAAGGGPGLVDSLTKAAERADITIEYGARASSLVHDDDGVKGVRVRQNGVTSTVLAKAVVLAAGGFQSNSEWRTRYLGAGWDLAKVRGTRFNTGDGIKMALDAGAAPWGQWSGAHAVSWEFNAPAFGDLSVGDGFQKHSYPFGVMVNSDGERFVDEGLDFRNYTYAKYGQEVLRQPGQIAWQVFDQKVQHLLRDEYRIRQVTKVEAGSLEELAAKMDGMNAARFVETITEFNESIDVSTPFNPNEKDGLRTRGLPVDKTNWANPLDAPPYEAYAVTCGITFTFGGLHVTTDAEVIDEEGATIPGLFACGELVGGIFYFNYPGGSGLTSGAVLGKIAGRGAAAR